MYTANQHFLLDIVDKQGLKVVDHNSNPAAPTIKNGVFFSENPAFKAIKFPVSFTGVNKIRKGKPGPPSLSLSGYPYRPGQILPSDLDITRQWSIVFYVYDIGTEKLERKRVLKDKLSAITSKEERLQYARRMIDEINYFLHRDMHLESEPAAQVIEYNFRGYSVVEGITYAKNHKLQYEGIRKGSSEEYDDSITVWKEFCAFKGYPAGFRLRDFKGAVVTQFFEYLRIERKNSNKTHNNRRANFHAVMKVLIDKDSKLFGGKNPVADVVMLKTETRKHAVYTDEQMKAIIASCEAAGEKHVVLFIQFMYYTLGRPDELCELRVGHIRLASRLILFLAKDSKTAIEQYVGISERFAQIIQDSGILRYPDHYFIFSHVNAYYLMQPDVWNIVTEDEYRSISKREKACQGARMMIHYRPGEHRVGEKHFYKHITWHIEALGYKKINPNYTLYSFCHTGAIALYRASRDIKLLQRQKRHANVEMTDAYLRQLGVFENFEQLSHWAGI
jgi:integrase